jgi:hypothetical protein
LLLLLFGPPIARAADPAPAANMPAPVKDGSASAAKTPAPVESGAQEVTLKGTLGCGKCSFHEAKACQNVLKVKNGAKQESYLLADNAVSQANHEKVCGPSAPATVTGTVSRPRSKKDRRKVLTASNITFD